jgi:hypothetical protein
MKKVLLILLLFGYNSFSQKMNKEEQNQLSEALNKAKSYAKPTKVYNKNSISDEKLIVLRTSFGRNKTIPQEFEVQTFIALSYYPELRDTHIEFIRTNIKTTMACRPTTGSLTRRYNREYVITIDNDDEQKGVVLDDVPFNAQVGVIGHELAHIIDYENKGTGSIAKLGVDYATGNYPPDFEKGVDKITIQRGLGWQLFDWADFVLNKSKASKEYKEFKRKTYLSPDEIKREIENDKQYQTSTNKGFWKNDFMIEIWGVCFGLCVSFVFQSDFRKLVLKNIGNV